ncbi:nucleotide sugar dehydrogenase [Planktomarina sp.]|nr:nucleotide sugar dehydrogenase [Planktomarina sp.]
MTTVGFVGMTHLGIVSSAAVAQKGIKTVCFDNNEKLIKNLKAGNLPIVEPDLDELISANAATQEFSSDIASLDQCDLIYVALDIATDDFGNSDTSAINQLIEQIATVLNPTTTMVILSQVEPGFTRALNHPANLAHRYYQVETLVFGQAVERATQPERYIIGCDNPSKPLCPHLKKVLCAFDCPILPMRYESAELAKISINFCLVSSISVANTLAEICESIGADWSEIVPALKLDRRIGQYSYLSPGLGIAGGNLERDLTTIERIGSAKNTDTAIVAAWKQNSFYRKNWAARTIYSQLLNANPNSTVAIWGLAYKENTHSIKNSPSIATIAQMSDTKLHLHDPVVSGDVVEHSNAEFFQSPLEALHAAVALMILTPWDEYKKFSTADIVSRMKGRMIIDPYRVLAFTPEQLSEVQYHTLGRASAHTSNGKL